MYTVLVVQVGTGRSGQAVTLATYREQWQNPCFRRLFSARLNVSEIEGFEPSPPPALFRS